MIDLPPPSLAPPAPAAIQVAQSAADFPSEANTGVPSGVTLKPSGPLVIDTPGAVVQGLDIAGGVTINAPDVTLANCRVRSRGFTAVAIKKGLKGVTVRNCDIDDMAAGGQGIAGQGAFVANNIHGCADGIDVRGDNTIIRDNYIHDMKGPPQSHFDTIQADGAFSDLSIEHNTLVNEQGQTSTLMLDNYWGPIRHVSIRDNLMMGGGYTVYIGEVAKGQAGGGPVTDVTFTDNLLGKGYYGYWNIRGELGHNPMVAGNRDATTGRLLPDQSNPPDPQK